MKNVQEEIREIRTQLRLAMNGVTSTSMRERGIVYKLNFGVPYPEIKEIARTHEPDAELAAALWREDIREFKILASFLQPAETFSLEEARRWVREIPYLEIAEHCSRNLFFRLPYMEDFVSGLLSDTEYPFARTVAFLVCAEHLKHEGRLEDTLQVLFLMESMRTIASDPANVTLKEKQAAIQSLKFYGRQSESQATEILGGFDALKRRFEAEPELREIYNELKFEFEYYR